MKLKRNLLIDVVTLTFTRVIVILASIVQGMILTRAFSKGEFAEYSQVLIPISIAMYLFGLSLPGSINFFIAGEYHNKDRILFISKILTLIIVLALLGACIIYISRGAISDYLNPDIKEMLAIVCILPVFRLVSDTYDNIFIAYGLAKKVAYRKTIMAILQIVTVIIVWRLGIGVYNFLLLLVTYEGIMFVYMFITLRLNIGLITFRLFSFEELRKVLTFVIPLAAASFVNVLNIQIDKIFINHYYGNEQFAEYAVVAKELPLILIATSISAVIIPQITRYIHTKNYSEAMVLWKNSVELSLISISWIIGILVVCGRECVLFLYSEKYVLGTPVFIIYVLIPIFRIIYFGMILNSTGKSRLILVASGLSLITNVILLFVLRPFIGYYSAPISTLLGVIVMNSTQLYLSKKALSITFREIMPWKNMAKVIIWNIIIGCVLYTTKSIIYSYYNIHYFIILIAVGLLWFLSFWGIYYKRFINLKNSHIWSSIY